MEYSPIECFLKHLSKEKHFRKENEPLSLDDIEVIKKDNIENVISSGNKLVDEGIIIPECVKSVYFDGKKLNGLPWTLENLILSENYECDLNSLPISLKILVIEDCNQPLDFLPLGLKRLSIEGEVNIDLKNLPNTLEDLMITYINKRDVIFPRNLKRLGLFRPEICPKIPDTIEHLSLSFVSRKIILKNIPKQLKKLSFIFEFDIDSNSVNEDIYFNDNNKDLDFILDINKDEFEIFNFSYYQYINVNKNRKIMRNKVIFWIVKTFGSVPKNLKEIYIDIN